MKQKTIKSEIYFSGTGLHTGEKISIKILPADADAGIRFIRIDKSHEIINGNVDSVVNSRREVALGQDETVIRTVEHLLAAFSGLEIDNAIVEMNASEPPVIDGSARPFVDLILQAGIKEQNREREYIVIDEPIWISLGGKELIALPSDEMKISFTISYDHPVIKTQFATFNISPEVFKNEIAPARTFGFLKEVRELWENDLAQGGTLDNAVIIGEKKIINGELRFENEFVRHKILDLIGDLYLLGKPLLAHIIAIKSGHSTNIALVQKIKEYLSDNKKVHVI